MDILLSHASFLVMFLAACDQCQGSHFSGPNLAEGKPAYQWPSTFEDKAADLAVDGDTDTDVANKNKCSHTKPNRPNQRAFWTVDLGRSFLIKGIRIYNRNDYTTRSAERDYEERLKNFRVFGMPGNVTLHDDRTTHTPLYRTKIINIAVSQNVFLQNISIEIPAHRGPPDNGKSYLTLCEVQIFAKLCALPDPAPNLKFEPLQTVISIYNRTYVNSLTHVRFYCEPQYELQGNAMLQCYDDDFNSRIPECTIPKPEAEKSVPVAAIGVGVGGVILVIVVLIYALCIRKRGFIRKKGPRTECTEGLHASGYVADGINNYSAIAETINGDAERKSSVKIEPFNAKEESQEHDYYCFTGPFKKPHRGFTLDDLSNFVLSANADHEKYSAEFQSFPEGMVKQHMAALQNKDKNRYKNIYAYDETRVVLDVWDSEAETDYINANYIHGFNKSRAYIASQGVTGDNLNDFWRMIWQTDSGKIVMLTNIWEENKVKCNKYWPDDGTMSFGRVAVTLQSAEDFSNFVIRTLLIKKDNDPQRRVLQFHFTAWPDRGVPTYSSSLVHFRSKVNNAPTACDGPTVVHCSAGIGRTGTYIALDFLTDQGRELGMVDVAGCVEMLRRQRVNMVQTKEQYVFIHQALVETLMLSTSALPAEKFPEAYKELLTVDPEKRERKLDLEYKALGSMAPVQEEAQYTTAKDVTHKDKNRYSNILPIADYMPSLCGPGHASDGSYINAAILPSYRDKNAMIITQSPLDTTKEDFWAMVYNQNVRTIVMMNHVSEMKENEIYWPLTEEAINVGDMKVVRKQSTDHDPHVVLTLTVTKADQERDIKILQFGKWNTESQVPCAAGHILTAIELVQDLQRKTGNHTVVVHCMDGAEKSGLFCVLYALLARTRVEHDVAIGQIIQEMRNRRKQIVPNVAQFQFCHEVVQEFLKQFETYSNFSPI